MKTLTIREPWASLIINEYKAYEFRSYKINYRGKILIHAGLTLEKENAIKFESYGLKYKLGYIIGEAEITDCIKVTKDFKKKLCDKDSLVYSNSNHTEEYAWKLDNIIKYDEPIKATGKLGLWNYSVDYENITSPYELRIYMEDNIKYGYLDKYGNVVKYTDKYFYENWYDNYILSSAEDVLKNKVGNCYDQVEFEYTWLTQHGYKTKRFYEMVLVEYKNNYPTHTFIVYENDNKYYYFENAFYELRGIRKFDSMKKLLSFELEQYKISLKKYNIDEKELSNIILKEYSIDEYRISASTFIDNIIG